MALTFMEHDPAKSIPGSRFARQLWVAREDPNQQCGRCPGAAAAAQDRHAHGLPSPIDTVALEGLIASIRSS